MVYEIDGRRFSTLEQFYEEVSRVLVSEADWGHNLDAFNDILQGGFGTPDDGFVFRWSHHELSKERLGYTETVRQLQLRLASCHPTNRDLVGQNLTAAHARLGPTVFDWLVEIIRDHGSGGTQADDRVQLVLA